MVRYEVKIEYANGKVGTVVYNENMELKVVFVRGIMEGVLPEHKIDYYNHRYEGEKVKLFFERMGENGLWYLYVHLDDVVSINYKLREGV